MSDLRTFHVACPLGLEEVVVAELQALRPVCGESPSEVEVTGVGGVGFRGDLRTGYAANLWLRSAIRVQEELVRGEGIDHREALYDLAASVAWEDLITPDMVFAFDGFSRDSFARDARFASLVCKDALVDRVRDRCGGRRPSVDRDRPDLPIKVVALGDRVTLYRSYTKRSLHKRGYRPVQTKGPLSEALAAGLLQLAGWRTGDTRPLCDPMCGSGTFAVEAAWTAAERAPGLGGRFAFERWPDFDARAWEDMVDDARQRVRRGRNKVPPIHAADRHPGAIELARGNAQEAGVHSMVTFHEVDVAELAPRLGMRPELVVCNPPYGARLGSGEDLERSWRALGDFVRGLDADAEAYVLAGDPELTRLLGLRSIDKWRVLNGSIDCRWLRYPVGRPD